MFLGGQRVDLFVIDTFTRDWSLADEVAGLVSVMLASRLVGRVPSQAASLPRVRGLEQ